MNAIAAEKGSIRIATASHLAFSLMMIAVGIHGLAIHSFDPLWQPVPTSMPAPTILMYLSAIIPLVTGVGLLVSRVAALAARVLLGFLLLWLLLRAIYVFISPVVNFWWPTGQIAVMVGAAWTLYIWLANSWDKQRVGFMIGNQGMRVARSLYGLALIPFGVAHFLYLQATVVDVPKWLGWPVAWSYFTGGALIVAGIAIVVGVFAKAAAALSALEMAMLTLLVWVPVVLQGANAGQWAEFTVSCALTAGSWVVADSYRRRHG